MIEKLPSEIRRLDLKGASYMGTGCHIEPTYINFFFGNNGVGKSTIAKTILGGEGITYAPGKSASDYLPLVYNQEFIDKNFQSYRNLDGVFTLNAHNASIQQQIDQQTENRTSVQKQITQATETRERKVKIQQDLQDSFHKDCWNRGKAFREEFSKSQVKRGRMDAFAKNILAAEPVDCDVEDLRRLYDSAFSDTAKRYPLFATIKQMDVLDDIEGEDILRVVIVNSAKTELAEFLRDIGSTEWMRQGHDEYSHNADGKCPYCSRKLPDDFEKTFIASFDTRYQDNLQKLADFLQRYKNAANAFFKPLQTLPSEIYPQIDTREYLERLEVLKAAISENIANINKKMEKPEEVVHLEPLSSKIGEVARVLDGYNYLIEANNAIVDAGPKKKAEFVSKTFSLLAFQLRELIAAYKKSSEQIKEEIDDLDKQIAEWKVSLEDVKRTLKDLRKQTVETESAKDSINALLRDSGMQGFSLQPKPRVEHVYEVRRPDGSIADNLSEGEKNFIAFLYFYHLVHGSVSADGDTREKIVVIDDPVSSMDSGSLFIVSTLVRQMIEICRNNADNRNPMVEGNFIKQIFILTHNAFFHREITHGYLNRYEYISFYLIRKLDCHSSVKLCDAVNPNIPTERMNVNPVKNSYAALWEEYREIKSAIPLMNVIRRILEYYFLQLCGYEGASLRQVILVDGKANGMFKDARGEDDEEKFQLAAAMLSYMNTNSTGIYDGIDYVDGCLDADECRNVFEMIFDTMQQKQHFDMMMGIQQ